MASEDIKINIAGLSNDLTKSLDEKLSTLSRDQFFPLFYRVSEKLRKANEAVYTPRLVSIGPLHRGQGQLHRMEVYKLKCLQNFMNRFGVGLPDLAVFAARAESMTRGCYGDMINLGSREHSEMILLDGIFIIELFLKNNFYQLRERSDIVFGNRLMENDLRHDLLLLENQLPQIIPEELFMYVDRSLLNELTLYDLAHEFFKDVGNTKNLPLTKEHYYRTRHFVDFLLRLHRPAHPRERPSSPATKFEYTRSATELHEVGVKFRRGIGNCLFEVLFDKGELTIPTLIVNDSTETFFRNLIAFEQSEYYSKDITSYVILMDSLINTPADVDLLVKCEIIKNDLRESKIVADLFNNLYKAAVIEPSDFYFTELCDELNEYVRNPFRQLKISYFRYRWYFISVLAGNVLLILTVIQTLCSIIQVKQGGAKT